MSLDKAWRDFLTESVDEKTIFTYIQGLQEIISNLKPDRDWETITVIFE